MSSLRISCSLLVGGNLSGGGLVFLGLLDGPAGIIGDNGALSAFWVVVDLFAVVIVGPEWLVTDAVAWAFLLCIHLFDLVSFNGGDSEEEHLDSELHASIDFC